ncbi:3-deoxy-7-phosphoheptulonate synthase [Streptomyces sp. NBC_01351]|uniref:3-deoxy-7-phosphoheptulonate synthase n=1 Tax=Streptomyces sp. NBC_01351 TaxID=2903833 RepID=UPI002E37890F|nr:3-deoxy-7-phosphoheptulonate synthase [Streptomyces sp. NBC_01351]
MVTAPLAVRTESALQQPDWADFPELPKVKEELSRRPALVNAGDVRRLRSHLARVAAGEAFVVQAGDCAEDPSECDAGYIARKSALLDLLAGTLKMITHKPVVRIGRLAGQFGKPRSRPTEIVDGIELPVFRGHMVNGPEASLAERIPDPHRLLSGYKAAAEAMAHLGWTDPARRSGICPPVWTSHEALLLDYELPMMRWDEEGSPLLTSTHFPWIGERTRQIDGAHVDMLAGVVNPVACKVGPSMDPEELVELCRRLDPWREPGRLTLIARMGADLVAERLPALVDAVVQAGHPVIWLTDPMHGNTVSSPGGLKTRLVDTVVEEVRGFQEVVVRRGGVAGGLHLETTPDEVTECTTDAARIHAVGENYTSFCDPRLNPHQAYAVVSTWRT